ncbi:MAG: hypothetical protein KGL39_49110 [Patescibacteria group bacterium]|nr:hypothetical protein [Patescibacteria group bacterium]
MSYRIEVHDTEPGWVAAYQKPEKEDGTREEGFIFQPVQMTLVRVEHIESGEDQGKDRVTWLHYSIHPLGGDLVQAQSHPDFVGIDFIPHHLMLAQLSGGGPNGIFVPNRQQRRHPGGLN